MKIMLAPMQGVVDHQMRQLLTDVGGYDRCVTEFVRVTEHPVPEKVFFRYCPELKQGGVTDAGVPVFVQLLGGNPLVMARSAKVVANLNVPGIDINFGCPAKVVNRNDGGSAILKTPHRVFNIINAVRDSVPDGIPVTAKLRLGFESDQFFSDILGHAVDAGVDELCIHARTKLQGYKPPAFWNTVGENANHSGIPVYINGEIWSKDDAKQATRQGGTENVMLGRGALSCPDLAMQIRAAHNNENYTPMAWKSIVCLVQTMFSNSVEYKPKYVGNRTKQWLSYLQRQYPEASTLFHTIKRSVSYREIEERLRGVD